MCVCVCVCVCVCEHVCVRACARARVAVAMQRIQYYIYRLFQVSCVHFC